MARIDTLTNFLTDVANAIRQKKGTTGEIPASNFDTEIASIQSGDDFYIDDFDYFFYNGARIDDMYKYIDAGKDVTTCNWMFSGANVNGKTLDRFFDLSKTVTMNSTFRSTGFTNVNLSNLNAKNVTDMSHTFRGMGRLITLNLTGFQTQNVTNLQYLFNGDSNLIELDLSGFYTSKCDNFILMFESCGSLKRVDFRNATLDKAGINFNNWFKDGGQSMEYLDIRSMDFANVTSYINMFGSIPSNCLIIVKDETAKAWVLDKRSDFTNVKTVAEYENPSTHDPVYTDAIVDNNNGTHTITRTCTTCGHHTSGVEHPETTITENHTFTGTGTYKTCKCGAIQLDDLGDLDDL